MKVNTSTFLDSKNTVNPVSIAIYQPKWSNLPSIADLHPIGKCLIPTQEMLKLYKSNPSPRSWSIYVRTFSQRIWDAAKFHGIETKGVPMSEVLAAILTLVMESQGWSEITLCCWEGAKNPRCHRKLIIDWLRLSMRGNRN